VNAVKYGGAARKVEVTMELPAGASGRSVSVSVRDHGIGIPPVDRGRVFEPFHRGANARQSGIPGSGLGLAFIKGVVRAHRGRVTFRGEPDGGTTFTVTLPTARARAEGRR
jgi:signal transduction histidine kinase